MGDPVCEPHSWESPAGVQKLGVGQNSIVREALRWECRAAAEFDSLHRRAMWRQLRATRRSNGSLQQPVSGAPIWMVGDNVEADCVPAATLAASPPLPLFPAREPQQGCHG